MHETLFITICMCGACRYPYGKKVKIPMNFYRKMRDQAKENHLVAVFVAPDCPHAPEVEPNYLVPERFALYFLFSFPKKEE